MDEIKKFCCDSFRFRYSCENSYGINVRIVDFSNEYLERSNSEYKIKFILTEGYQNKINDSIKYCFIDFCPFCGTLLSKFYKGKQYAQETIW